MCRMYGLSWKLLFYFYYCYMYNLYWKGEGIQRTIWGTKSHIFLKPILWIYDAVRVDWFWPQLGLTPNSDHPNYSCRFPDYSKATEHYINCQLLMIKYRYIYHMLHTAKNVSWIHLCCNWHNRRYFLHSKYCSCNQSTVWSVVAEWLGRRTPGEGTARCLWARYLTIHSSG
jgi:hypothetical protein